MMYVYMCMYIYIYICTNPCIHTVIHVYIHIYTENKNHMYIRTYVHLHICVHYPGSTALGTLEILQSTVAWVWTWAAEAEVHPGSLDKSARHEVSSELTHPEVALRSHRVVADGWQSSLLIEPLLRQVQGLSSASSETCRVLLS